MPYSQLFYHIVWTTKNREPLLTPKVELVIYGFLRSKAIGLEGTLFALNGTLDHTHMVASIPPKIAVATFIGQVKGVASTKFNKSGLSDTPFFWQEEYGVFSFDGKRLPNYIAYVENQKKHHAENNLLHMLERSDDGAVHMAREQQAQYVTRADDWWSEMQTLDNQ
jgi:putative transposase